MEFEQIVKRLEWLDEQHRKDKTALNEIEDRVAKLDGNVDTLNIQIKEINKKISNFELAAARLDQFDEILSAQRKDMNNMLNDLEKKYLRREEDRFKKYRTDLEEINNFNAHTAKDVQEFKNELKERSDEAIRMDVVLSKLKQSAEEITQQNEDITKSQKAIEDGRRQDVKRVADMQGEITSLRKRVDEFRQKTELHSDSLRNIENRFTEVISSESKRKQAQAAFLEQQSLEQAERDKVYKEWVDKVEYFSQHNEMLEAQTQSLDETLRAAKRAQESYVELNQKLERRINEITEMQRLGEERLRQEWVSFKSDDQKRWTGYTLTTEESMRDLRKTMDKFEERIITIDDSNQTLQDQLHQTTDTTEQQLQELMNIAHQWLTAYERIMGHVRKTPK